MARFALFCLFIAEILLVQAVASDNSYKKEAQSHEMVNKSAEQPAAPHSTAESSKESTEDKEESKKAEAPEIRRLGKHEHHHSDKSVAGGGIIIGGLVTAIFAAVFCYIRVTRKRDDAK